MRRFFRKFSKRLISCMLLFVMLTGTFYSVAADVIISHDGAETSMDLLYNVVSANLAPYGISVSAPEVQTKLIAIGNEKGLTQRYDATTNTTYDDNITKVSVYDIIISFISDYNEANGYNSDGTLKESASTDTTSEDTTSEDADTEESETTTEDTTDSTPPHSVIRHL